MISSSRAVTAFITSNGHFEFKRMPFGMKTAPISLSRMMNTILFDLTGKNVYAYLDDVIIFNKDPETHFGNLMEVFVRLKNAGLKAKLTKFEFFRERISFLGQQVDHAGNHTRDDKIQAVKISRDPRAPTRFAHSSGCVGTTGLL